MRKATCPYRKAYLSDVYRQGYEAAEEIAKARDSMWRANEGIARVSEALVDMVATLKRALTACTVTAILWASPEAQDTVSLIKQIQTSTTADENTAQTGFLDFSSWFRRAVVGALGILLIVAGAFYFVRGGGNAPPAPRGRFA